MRSGRAKILQEVIDLRIVHQRDIACEGPRDKVIPIENTTIRPQTRKCGSRLTMWVKIIGDRRHRPRTEAGQAQKRPGPRRRKLWDKPAPKIVSFRLVDRVVTVLIVA